jgi:hypothetical protein
MIKEHRILNAPGMTALVLKRKQTLASRITHAIETV